MRSQAAVHISFDGRSGCVNTEMSGEALLLQKGRSGPLGSIVLFIGALAGFQSTPQWYSAYQRDLEESCAEVRDRE